METLIIKNEGMEKRGMEGLSWELEVKEKIL